MNLNAQHECPRISFRVFHTTFFALKRVLVFIALIRFAGNMGRHFPVIEMSMNFEQTGKVRENQIKYWKTPRISDKCHLLFLVIFKLTVYCLLKWIKFSVKKTKSIKRQGKFWEISGSGKMGTVICFPISSFVFPCVLVILNH